MSLGSYHPSLSCFTRPPQSSTLEANALIRKMIGNAAVESFGLSHQVLFLEFRDDLQGDSVLSIETDIESNHQFDEILNLTSMEKALLHFSKVNLCDLVEASCDDKANLTLKFRNGMQFYLNGSPLDKSSEPWQLSSRDSVEDGGHILIATYGGGYAVWNSNIKVLFLLKVSYNMSSAFSAAAGPHALGYLYQAQYALYALLTADGEESALILARVYTQV